jgi:hypothetical protein
MAYNPMFAVLIVVTMQTVYMKIQTAQISLILSALLIVFVSLLVYKSGVCCINKNLLYLLFGSDFLFLLIPVLQLIFLPRGAINYSALVLITVLFTVFFTLCVLYLGNGRNAIRNFFDNIADTVVVITIISVCLFVVGQTLHWVRPTNSVTIAWGGIRKVDSYFFLLFNPQGDPYHAFHNGRFTGIFAEAPMNAFMLCFALIITVFVSKRKISLLRVVLLILAIWVTVSTTGYIVAIITIGCYIIMQRPKSPKARKLKLVFSIIAGLILVYVIYILYQQKISADVVSVQVRNNNLQNALEVFWRSPIFGIGFKADAIGLSTGDTSVVTQVLQQGGILLGLWYFVPIVVAVFCFIRDRNVNCILATIVYAVMLYVTTITYTGLSVAVVAVFLVVSSGLLAARKTVNSHKKGTG